MEGKVYNIFKWEEKFTILLNGRKNYNIVKWEEKFTIKTPQNKI